MMEVIVGNWGVIYSGHCATTARRIFAEYVNVSRLDIGRVGGNSVTLLKDGVLIGDYEVTSNTTRLDPDNEPLP